LSATPRIFRSRWSLANQRRSPKPPSAGGAKGPRFAYSHHRIGNPSRRVAPRTPLPSVSQRDVQVITMRRSTVARIGVAAVVLAALGTGFAVGLAISSPGPSTPAVKVVTDASVASVPSHSTNWTVSPPMAPPAKLPTVASCRPGQKSQARPKSIDIGCAGDVSMSAVTWSNWGRSTGDGSGTLTFNSCRPSCATGSVSSSPAFVVVSDPVGGVFQMVLITPPTGALTPQASSHPGLGWGSG
jgi:hypothetical protein